MIKSDNSDKYIAQNDRKNLRLLLPRLRRNTGKLVKLKEDEQHCAKTSLGFKADWLFLKWTLFYWIGEQNGSSNYQIGHPGQGVFQSGGLKAHKPLQWCMHAWQVTPIMSHKFRRGRRHEGLPKLLTIIYVARAKLPSDIVKLAHVMGISNTTLSLGRFWRFVTKTPHISTLVKCISMGVS